MFDTYKEYLKNEYKCAVEKFKTARQESMRKLMDMEPYTADDYGAGYSARVEAVSTAAAKVMQIGSMIKAYEHYYPEEAPVLDNEFKVGHL